MTELAGALVEVLQIAHETQMPHQEPAGGGGGTSPILIVAGLVVTLAVVAALVWLKKRVDTDAGLGIREETIDGGG